MSEIGGKLQSLIMMVILSVVLLAVGTAMLPTVIDVSNDVNATLLSGVPLATVIVLLATYIPAFFILAIVIGTMVRVWRGSS